MNSRTARFEKLTGKAPDLMGEIDITVLGYEEVEFLLDGKADSFKLLSERGSDGSWDVEPDTSADFRTRILVRRPTDPQHFSGIVVVEWNNVSGGIDASPVLRSERMDLVHECIVFRRSHVVHRHRLGGVAVSSVLDSVAGMRPQLPDRTLFRTACDISHGVR